MARRGKSRPKAPPGETRQRVADLDAKGLEPRDIARILEISTQAVYQHLENIRRVEPKVVNS